MSVDQQLQDLGLKTGKKLGSGGFSNVYEVKDHPKLVIRTQPWSPSTANNIINETKLALGLATLEVAPQIYHAFHDRKTHVFIMEKYDMDLKMYLKSAADTSWEMGVEFLLLKLARLFILCADIKPGNIVIKTNKKNDIIDMRLIDFGGDYCRPTKCPKNKEHVCQKAIFIVMLLLVRQHILKYSSRVYSEALFQNTIEIILEDTRVFEEVDRMWNTTQMKRVRKNYKFGKKQLSDILPDLEREADTIVIDQKEDERTRTTDWTMPTSMRTLNSEYTHIKSYTKSDGTRVTGHFRKR